MNGYSITNPDFVPNPRESNTTRAINKAVIRNDTGNLQVYQCHGKIKTERAQTRNQIEFERKTVGDVLNRLKMKQRINKIVLG